MAVVVAGVLVAAVVASVVFSNLRQKPADQTAAVQNYEKFNAEGVPEIRVRLFHEPQKLVEISTTRPWRVLIKGEEVAFGEMPLGPTLCWYADGKWNLGLLSHDGLAANAEITIESPDGYVGVNGIMYRGKVVLIADGRDSFWVQNHLDMESYLFSVVSKELYPDFQWEAFCSQAVAARTFAMYEASTLGKGRSYDVWASQRSQVYGGVPVESDNGRKAVIATRGMVLKYGKPGEEKIFLSQFSACNGGYVNGADVIRPLKPEESIPPLAGGQADAYGKTCPVYKWKPVKISKQDIFKALARQYRPVRDLGGLKELRIKTQTPYGRAIWLQVVGTNGKNAQVRAEDLQICLRRSECPQGKDVMSMNCKMRDLGDAIEFYDGKGFGHGVGLSQWGANERARDGMDYRKILNFYYPGAVVAKDY